MHAAGHLGRELDFLRERSHHDTLLRVRRAILDIDSPVLQDVFLDYLLRADLNDSESVIRRCVEQRLQARRISDSVRSAAIRFRDSKWTDALIKALN